MTQKLIIQAARHDATDPTRGAVQNYKQSQIDNARIQQRTIKAITPESFKESDHLPRKAHFDAVNALLERSGHKAERTIQIMARLAKQPESQANLRRFNALKSLSKRRLSATERIWAFYRDLFEQRLGPFAEQLEAMDKIALDCYQACYMGLGKARSIPTPPPLSYIDASTGPATFRRGVKVSRIARNPNPFPLVRLPYSRLIAPWSLGAVPHEIGHNIQNDLTLWKEGPRLIDRELAKRGLPKKVRDIWKVWHKEIYADLIGALLIGPAYVSSLMDVVGKSPGLVARFRDGAVHPTPIIRPAISNKLLRRLGFEKEATAFDQAWQTMYPVQVFNQLPQHLRQTFDQASEGTVHALVFKPHSAYGGRRLVDVVRFRPQDALVVSEAAERLAKGTNPGIIPERFLIAAARKALSRKLAPPATITKNFYNVLLGR